MSDRDFAIKLLKIAHGANPVENQTGDWVFDVLLPSTDGWQVQFFYDCGELDYIDHFISPTGEHIDVWEDDARFVFTGRPLDPEDYGFRPLQCWRGCADTERLVTALRAYPNNSSTTSPEAR